MCAARSGACPVLFHRPNSLCSGEQSTGLPVLFPCAQLQVSSNQGGHGGKKKKNYFFKHPVVMLCLPLQQPQLLTFFLPLCSWHSLHRAPAWVTLTAETLSPAMCAVCLAGLCTCLGSFLAGVMDVANKSWGLSVLSSCTTFNSMFLLHPLI